MSELGDVVFPDPTERTTTILIVEDEVLIRMVLSDFLQDCSFKVLEAGTAQEAIAILQASETPIDLVISDVNMPGDMDGVALAKWIKTNRPAIPVLLSSGDAGKADLAKAVCEKESFLPKPYDLQVAAARVRAIITQGRKVS